MQGAHGDMVSPTCLPALQAEHAAQHPCPPNNSGTGWLSHFPSMAELPRENVTEQVTILFIYSLFCSL